MITRTVLGAAAAIGLLAGASGASAQNVTIRHTTWLPHSHFTNTQIFPSWFAEIEKVTQGRVKVENLPKTVGTAQSAIDVVRDGLADISLVVTAYTPGRYPLTEMFELPGLGNDPGTMSVLVERTYRKHFMQVGEFKDVKLMAMTNVTPQQIFTRTKQVVTVDDLKGMKLRSPTKTTTSILNAVGAVPILKSSAEAFEMLSSGLIDGQLAQADTVIQSKSIDLMKFGTIYPGGLSNAVLIFPLNLATWNKISKADQAAIEAITTEKLAQKFGQGYTDFEIAGMKALRDAGYKIDNAKPELVAALQPAIKALEDDWFKRAKEKGIADPAAILAEFRAAVKAVARM